MEQRTKKLLLSIKNLKNIHEVETVDTASADNGSLSRSNNSGYDILKKQILKQETERKKMEGKIEEKKESRNTSKFASSIHS